MDRKRGSRSRSPQPKRQKVTHDTTPNSPSVANTDETSTEFCAENLASGLLTEENVERLRKEYAESEPYKYAKVETLFQDDLLRKVKDECLTHLSFTEKETDIYRVSGPSVPCAIDDPARFWRLRLCGCGFFSSASPTRAVSERSPFPLLPFSHDWIHLPFLSFCFRDNSFRFFSLSTPLHSFR